MKKALMVSGLAAAMACGSAALAAPPSLSMGGDTATPSSEVQPVFFGIGVGVGPFGVGVGFGPTWGYPPTYGGYPYTYGYRSCGYDAFGRSICW